MDIKELIAGFAQYDEMEAPEGMNIAEDMEADKEEANKYYNQQLLDERITDAKNALQDVVGYLKEAGRGDEDDLETLSSAIEVLTDL